MKALTRQFVDWPPWKQFLGEIEPYPLLNRMVSFCVSPAYFAVPSTARTYTPSTGSETGIRNLQNGPAPQALSGRFVELSYRDCG